MILIGHKKEKDCLRGDMKVRMGGQVSKLYEKQVQRQNQAVKSHSQQIWLSG